MLSFSNIGINGESLTFALHSKNVLLKMYTATVILTKVLIHMHVCTNAQLHTAFYLNA